MDVVILGSHGLVTRGSRCSFGRTLARSRRKELARMNHRNRHCFLQVTLVHTASSELLCCRMHGSTDLVSGYHSPAPNMVPRMLPDWLSIAIASAPSSSVPVSSRTGGMRSVNGVLGRIRCSIALVYPISQISSVLIHCILVFVLQLYPCSGHTLPGLTDLQFSVRVPEHTWYPRFG